jgi:hypothetical protein
MRRLTTAASVLVLAGLVQTYTHGRHVDAPLPTAPPIAVTAAAVRAPHPRLILDGATRERLKSLAKANTRQWQKVKMRCDRNVDKDEVAGYQGFDWAYAMAELALCWQATGNAKYGEKAVRYFGALVDDRKTVGDKAGGDKVIESDSGYPARTHGVYIALGYDWLHDAPGMTPELRARSLARLKRYIAWYREKGYHRDEPGTNYFLGYATMQIFAGLGASGEDPAATEWLEDGRTRLLSRMLLPQLATVFAGGDYPEGWQYGELFAAQVALIVDGWRTATGHQLDVPWLADVVRVHRHTLLPDGKQVYDGGDWSERPARPSSLALSAISHALEGQPASGAARSMLARYGEVDGAAWVELLGSRVEGALPLGDEKTSLHIASTGLTLMRSDWSAGAVFASMIVGPHLVEDHQHIDSGHFELWRGGDGLLIDGADYGSYGTINHNSLLVDDGGKVLNYSPNQGVWGYNGVRTRAFVDDGKVAVVIGDFADAYRPACAPREGCTQRAVKRAQRTLVFLRPDTLVVDDRVEVESFVKSVTWLGHTGVAPSLSGSHAGATVGSSKLELDALLPSTPLRSIKQPTIPDKGYAVQDNPYGPVWRIELSSQGAGPHRFLVVARAAAGPRPKLLHGEHIDGVSLGGTAVLFAADGVEMGNIEVPPGTTTVELLNLPGENPPIVVQGCRVAVQPPLTGGQPVDAAKHTRVAIPSCK